MTEAPSRDGAPVNDVLTTSETRTGCVEFNNSPGAGISPPGGCGVNKLYFDDNLNVLRAMPSESVDLIYLDPPFNSQADYGIIYGTKRGGASEAQSHAFDDMWKWGPQAKRALDETASRHGEAGALLDAFNNVFPESRMMAYLAMMAVRLIEMRRVLQHTGSLYLHCDPTASHYLKMILDVIFGPSNFRNEIIWKRTGSHSAARRWGDVHDSLLFYSKSDEYHWNKIFLEYDEEHTARYRNHDERGAWSDDNLTAPGVRNGDSGAEWKGFNPTIKGNHWKVSASTVAELLGQDEANKLTTTEKLEVLDQNNFIHWPKSGGFPRFKRYLGQGLPFIDVIADISPLNSQAQERLGYPTQKPLALLQRIIRASSNEGDVVLDPFCGCGTAIEAAELLGREWIGIDVTYLAIHVVEKRLIRSFGEKIKDRYSLLGQPQDADDARALAARDWLEFQKWAVFQLGGLPKDKPGADGGIDGIIRYHRVGIEKPSRAVVSVKGGLHVGVDAIHKLKSVVKRENAEIGVLVCLDAPSATSPMMKEAISEGEVGPPRNRVQKLQIIPVDQIFGRYPVALPGMIDPPEVIRMTMPARHTIPKGRKKVEGQTEMLLPLPGGQPLVKKKPSRQIRPVDIEVTRVTKSKGSKR